MPQQERYEIIITSKLDALPIPDMADAIWTRIERQLDIDMPSDEGGDTPQPPGPWGGGGMIAGAGLLVFAGALLTFFYFQKPETQNSFQTTPKQNIIAQPDTTVAGSNTATDRKVQSNSTPFLSNNTGITYPAQDSAGLIPVVSMPALFTNADSTLQQTTTAQPQVITPAETRTDSSTKKRRGVQGINDNDYRIIPKKDST